MHLCILGKPLSTQNLYTFAHLLRTLYVNLSFLWEHYNEKLANLCEELLPTLTAAFALYLHLYRSLVGLLSAIIAELFEE